MNNKKIIQSFGSLKNYCIFVNESKKVITMKRNLFYTVNYEYHDDRIHLGSTGWKVITVYEIVNNQPKVFYQIDLLVEESTKKGLQNWLNDNGYGDEEFEFKIL